MIVSIQWGPRMGTKTSLTVEDYIALEEPACTRYELSEGELIVTPSASLFHNEIRDEFYVRLRTFVRGRMLGLVTSETDLQLSGDVVRRPDVAFFRTIRLRDTDPRRVPLPLAPDLVVEVVSENDRADDLNLKVSQYLAAGALAVWLFYPKTRLGYRYLPGKLEPEVSNAEAGHSFEEPGLLPGFSATLTEILE